MRTLFGSCRVVSVIGEHRLEALAETRRPAVFTFWHNRSNYCGYFLSRRWVDGGHPLGVITSTSRDGEIAARMGKAAGLHVARGSVGGQGLVGLKALHRMAGRQGISVLSVADGSRGPIYEAQAGVVVLAQTAGAPLVPMSFAVSRCWRVSSWDRGIIPKPFSRIVMAVGEPIGHPQKLDPDELERAQSELEEALHALARSAQEELDG